jgi:PilZ domain
MPTERRKNARVGLAIPTRVQGFLADGTTWEEITTTVDVSQGGACFSLSHEAELGQVLLLSLPLPKRLRQYDLNDVSYRVYTLVRGVRRRVDQPRVGVMFFGKFPPRGFHERPAARYLLPSDSMVNAPAPLGLRPGDTGTPALGVSSASPTGTYTPIRGVPDASSSGAHTPTRGGPATSPSGAHTPVRGTPGSASTGTASTPALGTGNTPTAGIPRASLQETPATPYSGVGRPGVPPPPTPGASGPEFLDPHEKSEDRRGAPRVEIFLNFTIQQVDEWGTVLQEELTVADNVAKGGARVMTSLAFQIGDVILLQEAGGGFATRAEIRGITRIQPTIDRLHLHFLDREAPSRLLRA